VATGLADWWSRVQALLSMKFLDLTDTPGSYAGQAGTVPKVTAAEDSLDWSEAKVDYHSARHEEGGADPLTGIITKLNDHSARHEAGGSDVISVAGLSGLLASAQTPLAHKTSHQDGGADEINIAGLSGTSADLASHIASSDPHTQYQKESEKDVANGYATLLSDGALAAPGSDVRLTRNVSDNITFIERTSAEIVAYFHRIAINDYVGYIYKSGIVREILTAAHSAATPIDHPDGSISQAKLKTDTGSVSGQISAGSYVSITMNNYSLFPNIYSANQVSVHLTGIPNSYDDQTPRFALNNGSGDTAYNYAVRWRFIAASGDPIIVIVKKGSSVIGVWESGDPPPFWEELTLIEMKKHLEKPLWTPEATDFEIIYPGGDTFKKLRKDMKNFKKSAFELLK